MEIGPVGAAGALAQLAGVVSAQQSAATVVVAQQPGNAPTTLDQQAQLSKAVKAQPTSEAATVAQEPAQAQAAPTSSAATSDPVERLDSLGERQLFDYLMDVDRGGTTSFKDPSALVGTAMHSLEGALQQAQQAFSAAQQDAKAAGETKAQVSDGSASQQQVTQIGEPADTQPAPQVDMSSTLERSISFMWAAANVGLVVNSVTAATASANTLIKQQ